MLNRDLLYQACDSMQVQSPVLGDLLAQRSNQGGPLGLVDQIVGGGYNLPVPLGDQVPSTAQDNTIETYFRVPFALDCFGRPRDFGPWMPLFEKGKFIFNIAATTAGFPQTGANIKAAAATVKAALEYLPFKQPQIHAPSKFVRYEFNTAGPQLKLFQFGNGDGMLGINPGARLSLLLWLSSKAGMGGVDTIDKWTRVAIPWRHQRLTNNPEFMLGSFLANARARIVGSSGTPVVDTSGWPYLMGTNNTGVLLNSNGLFLPIIWPGQETDLSANQKQVGDLPIDAGFSANPNGTHVFRTLEHYSWQQSMVARIMGLMGYDTKNYTAQPKTHDNSDPKDIHDNQLWGLPLRVLPRGQATRPVL